MPNVIATKVRRNGDGFDVIDLDTDRVIVSGVGYSLANSIQFHLANPDAPYYSYEEQTATDIARQRAEELLPT